jgi:hypothetical protein
MIYTDSVRTSQETHCISATEPNRLMLCRESLFVVTTILNTHTLWAECRDFMLKQVVHIVTTGLKRVKNHVVKTYRDHTFLTSALYGGEWSTSLRGHFSSMIGSQSQYGRCGKQKNIWPISGVELRFLGCLTSSLVAITDWAISAAVSTSIAQGITENSKLKEELISRTAAAKGETRNNSLTERRKDRAEGKEREPEICTSLK